MIRLIYENLTTVDITYAHKTRRVNAVVDVSSLSLQHRTWLRALGMDPWSYDISGYLTTQGQVLWDTVRWISFDAGATRRACLVTDVTYPDTIIGHETDTIPFQVIIIAGQDAKAATPASSAVTWGSANVNAPNPAGTVPSLLQLTWQGPTRYFPLKQSTKALSGQVVTFARSVSELYSNIQYGINVPIWTPDGLLLDTGNIASVDLVAGLAKRTAIARVKSNLYPSAWVVGLTGPNTLTANQSNAETDTTGMAASGGTLTRDTTTPIAGAANFKVVSTGSNDLVLSTATTYVTVTAGRWYSMQALLKCTAAAGRQVKVGIIWQTSAGAAISTSWSTPQTFPSVATVLSLTAQAPATAARAYVTIDLVSSITGEIIYADSLMLEEIPPVLTIWQSTHNTLTIDTVNALVKWYDGTTTISAALSMTDWLVSRLLIEVMVMDDTTETLIVHPAGAGWTTQTGTLAALVWGTVNLGSDGTTNNLQGSLEDMVIYPYALVSAEYQAMGYDERTPSFTDGTDTMYVAPTVGGTLTMDADGVLTDPLGTDISASISGSIFVTHGITSTIHQSQGISARYTVSVADTYRW